ncbi:MAG: zinc metalloprotease [Acidobacteriota bacterium]
MSRIRRVPLALAVLLFALTPTLLCAADDVTSEQLEAWRGVASSDLRCAVPSTDVRAAFGGWDRTTPRRGVAADCSDSSTNPSGDYEPSQMQVIPVVVHILMDNACNSGQISDERVFSQIEILNEDFQAIVGTNGANGYNSLIQFELASVDPQGDPTTGITRTCNTTYFQDNGSYWNELAWDPNRYMNIYTNQAGGALGYVPFLPADGGGSGVGQLRDRVVILHTTFGRDAPFVPFDQGRTGTHEVGHYLGLEHTFSGGCGTSECYLTGDLICDTNSESSPVFGCPGSSNSCSTPDPFDNFMDYSDDLCMERFTQEQTRRMICTLRNYRDQLAQVDDGTIFADGFESGDITAW